MIILLEHDVIYELVRSLAGHISESHLSSMYQHFYYQEYNVMLFLLCVYSYKGHSNSDYKLDSCLSHDDAHVVSGSEDGRVCFWDLVEVCEGTTYTY